MCKALHLGRSAFVLLLSTTLFSSVAASEDNSARIDPDRLIYDFSIDEKDKFRPDLFIPFSWTDDLYGAVSYLSTSDYETEKVLGIQDSNKDSEVIYNTLNIYPLLWKTDSHTMGLDIELLDIDKKQSGYWVSGVDTFNFQNAVEIKVIKPAFYYQFNNLSSKYNGVLFSASLSPYSSLDVNQSTVFTGALSQSGSSSSEGESNVSFRLNLNGRYRFSNGLQSFFDFKYEYLPLEYELNVLQASGSFAVEKFDVVENIYKISYKIQLDKDLFYGLKPTFGISHERTDGENQVSGSTYDYARTMFVFGLEGL